MDEVIAKARELARLILSTQRFRRLRQLEEQVLKDASAKDLTARYEQALLNIRKKEQSMQPVSPEEKAELRKLQEEVGATPALQELARAQADYGEMMEAVNKSIHEILAKGFEGGGEEEGGADEEPAGGAGGGRIITP